MLELARRDQRHDEKHKDWEGTVSDALVAGKGRLVTLGCDRTWKTSDSSADWFRTRDDFNRRFSAAVYFFGHNSFNPKLLESSGVVFASRVELCI